MHLVLFILQATELYHIFWVRKFLSLSPSHCNRDLEHGKKVKHKSYNNLLWNEPLIFITNLIKDSLSLPSERATNRVLKLIPEVKGRKTTVKRMNLQVQKSQSPKYTLELSGPVRDFSHPKPFGPFGML